MTRPRIKDIVTIASRLTNVSEEKILSPDRKLHLCAVRSAIYSIAKKHGHSLTQIGVQIGGRDHSTVINGLKNEQRFAPHIGLYDEFVKALELYTATLPMFVSETDWQPPVNFVVRTSHQRFKERKRQMSILRGLEPVHIAPNIGGDISTYVRMSQRASSDLLRDAINLAA